METTTWLSVECDEDGRIRVVDEVDRHVSDWMDTAGVATHTWPDLVAKATRQVLVKGGHLE